MKRIDASKKKTIVFRQYVGNCVEDDGSIIELGITAAFAPVITFQDGTSVIMNWEDLIDIAKEYIQKLETEKPND